MKNNFNVINKTQVTIRLPIELKNKLYQEADEKRLSLNAMIIILLLIRILLIQYPGWRVYFFVPFLPFLVSLAPFLSAQVQV